MLNLLLGIVFFNVILILFKLFDKYKVDNLQAIIINYLVAGTCGLIFTSTEITPNEIFGAKWVYIGVLIGLIFIVVFNLLATSAQKVGLALSTVANKMSVILPVVASFFLYGDDVSFLKILGILLALGGVVLSSISGGSLNFDKKYLWLILFIFFGQGIADILFNYAQKTYVESTHQEIFISVLFLSAFVCGLFILTGRLIQKKEKLRAKNILWGIALGVPNYLTVFYFFKALESGFMQSSQVYPILNMGVIVLSALTGLLLFKEKLSGLNWLGIGLSVLAIVAIIFG